ncbi:hypothetical protein D3C81_1353850 [compost metagenome]
MGGGKGHAQARATGRDGRRTNRTDHDAVLAQLGGEFHGLAAAADEDRLDWRGAVHQGQADGFGTGAEACDQRGQMLATPAFPAQQLQALQRRAGHRRRLAGGVDVGAGELDQRLDQLLAAGDEGASGAEGLAEGTDQHRHIFHAEAEVFDDAAAIGAQRAEAMGVIDHHPGALPLGGGADCRQVGEVAIHAEHTVGHDQGVAFGLVQTRGEAGRIVVQVAREARAGKQPGIQ